MTTKFLRATYASGYNLAPAYSALEVEPNAAVYGSGVYSGHSAFIFNYNKIKTTPHTNHQGILLAAGGHARNGSYNAYISGAVGVQINGAAGSVYNVGTIFSTISAAVYLTAGGVVANGSAPTNPDYPFIKGATNGVVITGGAGTVTNFAAIYALNGDGVQLDRGGSVLNGMTVTSPLVEIYATNVGVEIGGGVGTVINSGKIVGTGNDGVFLGAGGYVSNSLEIGGGLNGVYASVAGTVKNSGTITGGKVGVNLASGGSVSNSGEIEGVRGASIGVYLGAGGSVSNSGLIKGSDGLLTSGTQRVIITNGGSILGTGLAGSYGAVLRGAQSVTISGGGVVEGYAGVKIGAAVATNLSRIEGSEYGAGVLFAGSSGGRLVNGSKSASVGGQVGVVVAETSVAVVNFGYIGSTVGGQAFTITSASYAASLTAEAGCVFHGKVSGNVASTLDLGAGSGTISNLGSYNATVSGFISNPTTFYGFGGLTLLKGAAFTLTGAGTVAAKGRLIVQGALTDGDSVTNAGLIETSAAGVITLAGPVANTGVIRASGGTLIVNGAVTGSGYVVIAAGLLSFGSTFNERAIFSSGGTLQLAKSQSYTASITGFSTAGKTFIDLQDIGFVSSGEASFSGTSTSGVLTVSDGTHTAHIHLTGDYLGSTFVCASDGHGGVIVHDPPQGPAPATGASASVFAAAMAGLGAGAAPLANAQPDVWRPSAMVLSRPRFCSA